MSIRPVSSESVSPEVTNRLSPVRQSRTWSGDDKRLETDSASHQHVTHFHTFMLVVWNQTFSPQTHTLVHVCSLTLWGQDFQVVNPPWQRIRLVLENHFCLPSRMLLSPKKIKGPQTFFFKTQHNIFPSHQCIHNSLLLLRLTAASFHLFFLHSLWCLCTLRNLSQSYVALIFHRFQGIWTEVKRRVCVWVCVRVCCGEYSSDKGQGTGAFRRRLMMFFLTLSLPSALQSSSGLYSGQVISVCVFNVLSFFIFHVKETH